MPAGIHGRLFPDGYIHAKAGVPSVENHTFEIVFVRSGFSLKHEK